jgi:hypothetical protein
VYASSEVSMLTFTQHYCCRAKAKLLHVHHTPIYTLNPGEDCVCDVLCVEEPCARKTLGAYHPHIHRPNVYLQTRNTIERLCPCRLFMGHSAPWCGSASLQLATKPGQGLDSPPKTLQKSDTKQEWTRPALWDSLWLRLV